MYPNAHVFTFEPLPDNFKIIEQNIAKYNVKNVRCFNKALSSKNGFATFYVSEGRPTDAPETDWDYGNKSSSLLPPDKHTELVDFIQFNKKIEVETITLSSFCAENDIDVIDYIHMDVQGAELMVLEGAGDYINSVKAIWLEVAKVELYKDQPLENEVEAYMKKRDFVLVKNSMHEYAGDQLYVSKKYYPNYRKLFFPNHPSLLERLLHKIGLSSR